MRVLIAFVSLLLCGSLQAQVTVVSAASFRPEQPVAPGAWAAAFGTFTGVPTLAATDAPFPTSLEGVSVTVDGTAAPVYFISEGQINFLIPYSSSLGVRPIQVHTASATLDGTVRIMPEAPALFVKDTSGAEGPPKGAILNQDYSENTSSNMAQRGQVIQIYGSGGGALTTPVDDGALAPSDPLATTTSTPQVFIGGVEAAVQYSGLAPQLVGVWQVNAVIPDKSFLSGHVPVVVFVDGVDSNEVGIFVSQ